MKRKFLTSSMLIIATLSLIACSGAGKFDVDSKKGMTYITIPAYLNPSEEIPKILMDAGFIESETNGDESVTYSIPEDEYEVFVSTAKSSIDDNINQINDSEDSSINEIKTDKALDTITATIDTESFKESNDDLILNALALKILHYKAYTGDDLSVKIKLIDSETKEVYDTMTIEQ